MNTAGEPIDYRCLIRATDGKKTISGVCNYLWFCELVFVLFCHVLRMMQLLQLNLCVCSLDSNLVLDFLIDYWTLC